MAKATLRPAGGRVLAFLEPPSRGIIAGMTVRPCPMCRKPVNFETNPTRPFCSARCKMRDLGAWSTESYKVPDQPEKEVGEGWSEPGSPLAD